MRLRFFADFLEHFRKMRHISNPFIQRDFFLLTFFISKFANNNMHWCTLWEYLFVSFTNRHFSSISQYVQFKFYWRFAFCRKHKDMFAFVFSTFVWEKYNLESLCQCEWFSIDRALFANSFFLLLLLFGGIEMCLLLEHCNFDPSALRWIKECFLNKEILNTIEYNISFYGWLIRFFC